MSTGLHAAREDLHLPNISSNPTYNQSESNGTQPKPLSLSPRTFGMEDLRDFCGPLGSFKTGLTPRVFSTGLTPRSGFTPRFTTGFTPRLSGSDANSYFGRFSPPRQGDGVNKISPTGYTPKDVSGIKVPMRFPGTFTSTPLKMEQLMGPPPPQQIHKMHQSMPHMTQPLHPDMNHMNAAMFDYMNRPTISQQQQQHPHDPHDRQQTQQTQMDPKSQAAVSPMSDEHDGEEPEDLDERRRMKNRERVRKCRKRKQDRLNFLEDRTNDLEKENNMLKAKLARKAEGGKSELLTEAQVKEVRKKQNTTLAAYVRAYNESTDGGFAVAANSIWSEDAEIVYGNDGMSIAGLNLIISNKQAAASVFEQFKIKNYSVQWKEYSHEKCLVHWEIDVVVKPNAPRDVPFTMPFAELGSFFASGEVITLRMNSHLKFEDGKIVEEIRQLNLANMAETVLSKFAQEPTISSSVLRCLMNA